MQNSIRGGPLFPFLRRQNVKQINLILSCMESSGDWVSVTGRLSLTPVLRTQIPKFSIQNLVHSPGSFPRTSHSISSPPGYFGKLFSAFHNVSTKTVPPTPPRIRFGQCLEREIDSTSEAIQVSKVAHVAQKSGNQPMGLLQPTGFFCSPGAIKRTFYEM